MLQARFRITVAQKNYSKHYLFRGYLIDERKNTIVVLCHRGRKGEPKAYYRNEL